MGLSFEKLKHPSQSPPSVMGRASVKGFGQVKNPAEDLILHRVLRHKFRSLLFLFHCTRTSGLKDTPLSGLRSSIRSQPHGCHSMPGPNLVPGYLRALGRAPPIGTAFEGDDLAAAVFEAGHPQRFRFLA